MINIQLLSENNRGIIGDLTPAPDTDVAFTRSVADVEDISKRKSTFSKSIKIIGNNENNALLGHIYNINATSLGFNRQHKQPCVVTWKGGVMLDNCIMQLIDIQTSSTNSSVNEKIEYTVCILSEMANIFDTLKQRELTDIVFGVKDIPLNNSYIHNPNNVINSFSNTILNGFKMCVRAVTSGSSGLMDFTPAIYLKKYFDRMISDAGFRYTFEEIGVVNSVKTGTDTLKFEKILIPFTGEIPQATSAQVAHYSAELEGLLPVVGQNSVDGELAGVSGLDLTGLIEISDPSNSYSSLKYTSQVSGILEINLNMTVQNLTFNNESGQEIKVQLFNNTYYPSITDSLSVSHVIGIKKNGNVIYSLQNSTTICQFATGQTYLNGSTSLGATNDVILNANIPVVPGDSIEVVHSMNVVSGLFGSPKVFRYTDNTFASDFHLSYDLDSNVAFTALAMNGLSYGSILDFNQFIPTKIKQSDFFKSILNAFNIYVDIDQNDNRLLIFKTRNYFYDSGKKHNFNDIFAKEKGKLMTFLSDTQKKSKLFTYKNSTESLPKLYTEKQNEIYGQANFRFDSEFLKEEDKLELIFNPAVAYNSDGYILTDFSVKNSLLMILDGGQINKPLNVLGWSGATGITASSYPSTLHVDNYLVPSLDLNFGFLKANFTGSGATTNNNLFNLYWRRTMHQLNTGRMVKLFIVTDLHVWRKIELNDSIEIEGVIYNINAINNFNIGKTKLTEFELFTVDDSFTSFKGIVWAQGESVPFTPAGNEPIKPFLSGNNVTWDKGVRGSLGKITGNILGYENIVAGAGTTVIGNGNTVMGAGATVIGDGITLTLDGETNVNGRNFNELPSVLNNIFTAKNPDTGIDQIAFFDGNLTQRLWIDKDGDDNYKLNAMIDFFTSNGLFLP